MSLLAAFGVVLAGLGAATGVGWFLTRAWSVALTRREQFAWALAVGLLIQAACLLVLIVVGFRPSAFRLLLSEAVVAGLAARGLRGKPSAGGARVRSDRRATAVVVILAFVTGMA
ncbi:MAG: hypothetical protein WD451_01070 [Thermoanaerobaculia bacterium]